MDWLTTATVSFLAGFIFRAVLDKKRGKKIELLRVVDWVIGAGLIFILFYLAN